MCVVVCIVVACTHTPRHARDTTTTHTTQEKAKVDVKRSKVLPDGRFGECGGSDEHIGIGWVLQPAAPNIW